MSRGTGDPNRDWGRPSGPVSPKTESVRDSNSGCWLTAVVVVAGALTSIGTGSYLIAAACL